MTTHESILFEVLKNIAKNKICDVGLINRDYYKAIETIGLIDIGWHTQLTTFGKYILEILENKLKKY